jgi:hypothetical protein
MEGEIEHGLASLHLSQEKEKEFFTRCLGMVDYVNKMAMDILMDFIDNASGPLTRQVLRNTPEVVAIKAFEKALDSVKTVLSD